MATAFEHQCLDVEDVVQLTECNIKVKIVLAGKDIGYTFVLKILQVSITNRFGENFNDVVTVDLILFPSQFPFCVYRYDERLCSVVTNKRFALDWFFSSYTFRLSAIR